MIPHFLLVADQNFVQLSQRDGILMVFLPFDGERIRDGVKKSKWKFKMAFAMKGGRGLEGVSSATYLF